MTGVACCRVCAALVVVVATLAIGACGDTEQRPERGGGSGRLVVQKSLARGPVFVEGSQTQLRIAAPDGRPLFDGVREVEFLDEPIFDVVLPGGTYSVTAVERPCLGNCGALEAPAEETRCAVEARVEPGRTTLVRIVLRGGPAGARSDCSATTGRSPAALLCPTGETDENLFDARTLDGMMLSTARETARKHGCTVRVVKRDGRPLAVTRDLRRNRINVAVVGRTVVRVESIG